MREVWILACTVAVNCIVTVAIVKKMTIQIITDIYRHIQEKDKELFDFIEDKL